jgi:hypothetical protein
LGGGQCTATSSEFAGELEDLIAFSHASEVLFALLQGYGVFPLFVGGFLVIV